MQNFLQAYLNYNSQVFNLLRSKLYSTLYTLNFTFKKVILSKGVGYKFFLKKTKYQTFFLKIKAGYNKPLLIKFLNTLFKLKIPKPTRVCLRSNNLQLLMLLTRYIKQYRIPNVYTGKGFRSRYDKRIRKEVHKSK
jgi:ribosomal protein L6P/L9E